MFQLLEVLYSNRLPKTCKQIEEEMTERHDWYVMSKTSRRKLESTLQKLLESAEEIIERVEDVRPYQYTLADLFDKSSTKYGKKDLRVFEEWKVILDTYDYIPFMSDLKEVVARDFNGLEDTIVAAPAIDLPVFEYYGKRNIKPLFEAIIAESKIDFTYINFMGVKSEIIDFMPYLLKEHNKRWYVVGKTTPGGKFLNYSLEKISDCIYSNKKDVFDRDELDAKELFQHSIGIYTGWIESDLKYDPKAKERTDPIDISFKVKDGSKFDNVSYLITNKIHPSQKESKPDNEGWMTISLNMFPEADLIREIRRIGLHCVDDIKPPFVKKWVEEL